MAEKKMQEILQKAEVLIEALPYIQRFNRKIIVVKYGGSAMVDDELKMDVIKDVTLARRMQRQWRLQRWFWAGSTNPWYRWYRD